MPIKIPISNSKRSLWSKADILGNNDDAKNASSRSPFFSVGRSEIMDFGEQIQGLFGKVDDFGDISLYDSKSLGSTLYACASSGDLRLRGGRYGARRA